MTDRIANRRQATANKIGREVRLTIATSASVWYVLHTALQAVSRKKGLCQRACPLKLLEFATVGCCRRDNDGALVPYAQNPNLDNDLAQRSGGTTTELLQS